MRVVVVGHTGNVGSAVVRLLSASPDIDLVGIARRRPAAAGPWKRVDARTIDISDPSSAQALASAFQGADAVVHLAWALQPNHRPRSMARTNVSGLIRVLNAAVRAGVPHVAVASSVGAYGFGPKHSPVDESWPTGGIPTSHYSRQKAQGERIMDEVEARHPELALTRMRPGLVMQHDAASEIARLFLGAVAPLQLITRLGVPGVPLPGQLISQVVHADDLAAAFLAALRLRRGGAFNIAADPWMTPQLLAAALGGRWIPIRQSVVRAILDATWRARIQRSDPGWLDLACSVPVMDTTRARTELAWTPRITADEALADLLRGLRDRGRRPESPSLA